MTKEELEKEAEESSKKAFCIAHTHEDELIYMNGYLAGAKSREKQIQIDVEHIIALQKQNGELTDKVRELEAQIEKMKNWCNCKNYQQCLIELAEQGKGMKPSECCVNCKKWEIKEK